MFFDETAAHDFDTFQTSQCAAIATQRGLSGGRLVEFADEDLEAGLEVSISVSKLFFRDHIYPHLYCF